MGLPPFSLYVHFPWCVRKCPYCDFNSHTLRGDLPGDEYINALLRDLESAALSADGRELQSVFFGGGTPSLFAPAQFERLLKGVRSALDLAPNVEVTLEANPGAVEHSAFAGYREAGINRLSLGVQSLNDAALARLGRIHSARDARAAVAEARAAGFGNINLDLMYALPEQDEDAALDDLRALLELQPDHVSHYHLTLEPNTVFYHHPPRLPDDDTAWAMQSRSADVLQSAGYQQYEVSAWARPGRESRHNLNYWRFGDYLGLGAGAHAKLTNDAGRYWRETRPAHPTAYLRAIASGNVTELADARAIEPADRAFEFLLNQLRLRDGFECADFERLTGLPMSAIQPALGRAQRKGLLEQRAGQIRPTELGWRFLDDLQAIFLPGDTADTG